MSETAYDDIMLLGNKARMVDLCPATAQERVKEIQMQEKLYNLNSLMTGYNNKYPQLAQLK